MQYVLEMAYTKRRLCQQVQDPKSCPITKTLVNLDKLHLLMRNTRLHRRNKNQLLRFSAVPARGIAFDHAPISDPDTHRAVSPSRSDIARQHNNRIRHQPLAPFREAHDHQAAEFSPIDLIGGGDPCPYQRVFATIPFPLCQSDRHNQ